MIFSADLAPFGMSLEVERAESTSPRQDFVRRFAKIGRHIQHTIDDESTGGILTRLLNGFSDKVDEFDREYQKT